jgi:HEAT repeat protein
LSTDDADAEDKLSAALTALNSEDVLTQNEGVESVIELGAVAVPPLLAALEKNEANRAQVMYALSQIADQRAAPALQASLRDADERVRAYAAQGLARIGDPEALEAILQTLDDAADELHLDITPSVQTLGGMGLKAVPPLLGRMMDENEMTRLHAQRALERILAWRHTPIAGEGILSPHAAKRVRSEWSANGDYDYSAPANERAASVEKWRQWLKRVEK